MPVWRRSQRRAAFARAACQVDDDHHLAGADPQDVVERVRQVLDRCARVRVDDDLARLTPPGRAHQLGLRVRVRHASPPGEHDDVLRGCHLRRTLEARGAHGVELASAAVRVAEDDDDPHGRHDLRLRSQRKKSSVPTTVSTSFTAFRPWSFDWPWVRSRMWTASSSTRMPSLFSRSRASTSGALLA